MLLYLFIFLLFIPLFSFFFFFFVWWFIPYKMVNKIPRPYWRFIFFSPFVYSTLQYFLSLMISGAALGSFCLFVCLFHFYILLFIVFILFFLSHLRSNFKGRVLLLVPNYFFLPFSFQRFSNLIFDDFYFHLGAKLGQEIFWGCIA